MLRCLIALLRQKRLYYFMACRPLSRACGKCDISKGVTDKVKGSQVKYILPTCKTKVGTGGKRRKILRLSQSAAPYINNLKRFTLSGYFT